MMQLNTRWILALSLTVALSGELFAKVTEEEAQQLGVELTPVGAVQAGNAEGTIPEWIGGIIAPPDEYKGDGWLANPFSGDQPLFTISKDNVEEYKENLSPGQYEMFEKYPDTWKMVVYKTRRSVGYDNYVYDAMKENALVAELSEDGKSVKNAKVGSPFPIPANGLEAVWNHILKHRGSYDAVVVSGVPTPSGAVTFEKARERFVSPYSQKSDKEQQVENVVYHLLNTTSAPANKSGQITLVKDVVGEKEKQTKSWFYNPKTGSTTQTSKVVSDRPIADGELWGDALGGINGSLDKFEFELIGKSELYIPYNNYELISPERKYVEIVQKGHFNPDILRFELHRVWEVEVTLKEKEKHVSPRRTLYLDEDSWSVVVADFYDGENKLTKTMQLYEPFDYLSKGETLRAASYVNLVNGRYFFEYLRNEEKAPKHDIIFNKSVFTPGRIAMEITR